MKPFGQFLSNLRNSAGLNLEELALLSGSSKSTLSRLENDDVPRPFKGPIRKLIITLAEILCASPGESERYLELAGINRSLLTETEVVQSGFDPYIPVATPAEVINLERLERIYEQRLAELEPHRQLVKRLPTNLATRLQNYTNSLNEIEERLARLNNRQESPVVKTPLLSPAHFVTESILLLNFAHPLTELQKITIEKLTGLTIEKTLNVQTLIDEAEALAPQISRIVDSIGLSNDDWQRCRILINPPGYAPAAFLLLAEIHGRSGHFPSLVRLRPKQGSITTYEVAEIINLQTTRDTARASNNASAASNQVVTI